MKRRSKRRARSEASTDPWQRLQERLAKHDSQAVEDACRILCDRSSPGAERKRKEARDTLRLELRTRLGGTVETLEGASGYWPNDDLVDASLAVAIENQDPRATRWLLERFIVWRMALQDGLPNLIGDPELLLDFVAVLFMRLWRGERPEKVLALAVHGGPRSQRPDFAELTRSLHPVGVFKSAHSKRVEQAVADAVIAGYVSTAKDITNGRRHNACAANRFSMHVDTVRGIVARHARRGATATDPNLRRAERWGSELARAELACASALVGVFGPT